MHPLAMYLAKKGMSGLGAIGKGAGKLAESAGAHLPGSVGEALEKGGSMMQKHSKLTGAAAVGAGVGAHAMVGHGDEEEAEHDDMHEDDETDYEKMLKRQGG